MEVSLSEKYRLKKKVEVQYIGYKCFSKNVSNNTFF